MDEEWREASIGEEWWRPKWLRRLIRGVGEKRAAGQSKHARARRWPRGWRRMARKRRKLRKLARRAHRGAAA